jgi:hypothetical protein
LSNSRGNTRANLQARYPLHFGLTISIDWTCLLVETSTTSGLTMGSTGSGASALGSDGPAPRHQRSCGIVDSSAPIRLEPVFRSRVRERLRTTTSEIGVSARKRWTRFSLGAVDAARFFAGAFGLASCSLDGARLRFLGGAGASVGGVEDEWLAGGRERGCRGSGGSSMAKALVTVIVRVVVTTGCVGGVNMDNIYERIRGRGRGIWEGGYDGSVDVQTPNRPNLQPGDLSTYPNTPSKLNDPG